VSNPRSCQIAERFQQSLRKLLPSDVAIAGGGIIGDHTSLFAAEHTSIAGAAAVRQAEFAAGRTYARAALRTLGCSDQPILSAQDRRPIWPAGFTGSISHSRTLCVAIVACRQSYTSLGVDVEPAIPLKPILYSAVGRQEERQDFACPINTPMGMVDRGKLVFAIKEAVFKAYYPVTRFWLDFQHAMVDIDKHTQRFTVHLVEEVPEFPGAPTLTGRWSLFDGHILVALALVRL